MNDASRIEWIDSVKGFGIILVILGHMAIPEMARQFIFSFHMPLFFFVSGYLYKGGGASLKYVLRKIDALIIPYVLYSFIALAVWVLTGKVQGWGNLKSICLGEGIGVTWFFICLFFTEMIGSLLLLKAKENMMICILAAVAAVVSSWTSHLEVSNYYMFRTVPAALAIWLAGHCYRGMSLSVKMKILIFAVAAAGLSMFWLQRIDMASARIGNMFLFYGSAFGGIYIVFALFEAFNMNWKALSFAGRNSLVFMCFHGIIPMTIAWAMLCFGVSESGIIAKSLIRVSSCGLLFLAAIVVERYVPALAGRIRIFSLLLK